MGTGPSEQEWKIAESGKRDNARLPCGWISTVGNWASVPSGTLEEVVSQNCPPKEKDEGIYYTISQRCSCPRDGNFPVIPGVHAECLAGF